jgi:high-affinity Fe2+/Pb2+ permease
VFGAMVIAGWLVRWWQRTPTTPPEGDKPESRWPWLTLLAIGALTGVAAAVTSPSVQVGAFRGATRGGGAIAAAGLLLALGWHLVRYRQRSAA